MDKNYWDNYYQSFGDDKNIIKPSSFAQFILDKYLTKKN
jgi:hypothetical protein